MTARFASCAWGYRAGTHIRVPNALTDAPEGGLDIDAYRHIVAWFQRLRALPDYVPMPGMWQA